MREIIKPALDGEAMKNIFIISSSKSFSQSGLSYFPVRPSPEFYRRVKMIIMKKFLEINILHLILGIKLLAWSGLSTFFIYKVLSLLFATYLAISPKR